MMAIVMLMLSSSPDPSRCNRVKLMEEQMILSRLQPSGILMIIIINFLRTMKELGDHCISWTVNSSSGSSSLTHLFSSTVLSFFSLKIDDLQKLHPLFCFLQPPTSHTEEEAEDFSRQIQFIMRQTCRPSRPSFLHSTWVESERTRISNKRQRSRRGLCVLFVSHLLCLFRESSSSSSSCHHFCYSDLPHHYLLSLEWESGIHQKRFIGKKKKEHSDY